MKALKNMMVGLTLIVAFTAVAASLQPAIWLTGEHNVGLLAASYDPTNRGSA